MKVLILFAAIILLGACASTPSIREKVTGTYAAKQGGGVVGWFFEKIVCTSYTLTSRNKGKIRGI